ncbi:hypothetical protein DL767_000782 [Monosporascus sp. MG133]|nr:hypothetical protein DL767_000782 [Monosporascus sp. MG133]
MTTLNAAIHSRCGFTHLLIAERLKEEIFDIQVLELDKPHIHFLRILKLSATSFYHWLINMPYSITTGTTSDVIINVFENLRIEKPQNEPGDELDELKSLLKADSSYVWLSETLTDVVDSEDPVTFDKLLFLFNAAMRNWHSGPCGRNATANTAMDISRQPEDKIPPQFAQYAKTHSTVMANDLKNLARKFNVSNKSINAIFKEQNISQPVFPEIMKSAED